ncbi:MAG: carbon-nitrogen hydrolase family protein [Acetobacteraceae bacterium]
MRVSVVQMNPGADKAANIAQARRLLDAAIAADRPDIVSLPEVWTCLGGSRAGKFEQAEDLPAKGSNAPGGPAYEFLREVARGAKIHVHGGSMQERGGERLFNTTVVFDPDGREIARYRKIHLFDITTPDGTGFRESNTYDAGDETVTYRAGDLTIGAAICYDLRFPELFARLRAAGAELIMLPSAFTLQTGKDHWEPLLRARAIETQCWLAAAATWGRHLDGTREEARSTYGHSLVADPWGQVVAQASDGVGWATARIDPALTARVRRDMPVEEHRAEAQRARADRTGADRAGMHRNPA